MIAAINIERRINSVIKETKIRS